MDARLAPLIAWILDNPDIAFGVLFGGLLIFWVAISIVMRDGNASPKVERP